MTGSAVDIATRLVPALLVVVAAPLGVLWWSRRNRTGPARPVRVVGRAGLGRNVAVAVVAVDRRRFLVGAGEHGVRLLGELEPEPELAAALPAPTEPGFPLSTSAPGQDDPHSQRPWTGLVRRLQQMTLRTAPPSRRPSRAPR